MMKSKRTRRGRDEGSITRRSDGRWMARIHLDPGPDGKRRRKTVYGKTRHDVAQELNRLLGKKAKGELFTTSTPTVAAWLTEWHTTHAPKWRPSTRRVYKHVIDTLLVPAFGTTRLERLTPQRVQQWINEQTAAGGARVVILMALIVLRKALGDAQRLQMIGANVAALVVRPRPIAAPVTPFTLDEVRKILDAARGHHLEAAICVGIMLGLREGELCGLEWKDVDLDAKLLNVRRQAQRVPIEPAPASGSRTEVRTMLLKTARSRRGLDLPAACVTALRAHRTRQLERRLKLGDAWQANDYVFPRTDGSVRDPRSLPAVLHQLCKAAKVEPRKFHTLRHTTATLLLAHGEDLFGVSRILGHASIKTTADVYGHLAPSHAARVAERMNTLLTEDSDPGGVKSGVKEDQPARANA